MAVIVKKLHQGMKRLLNKKGQGLVEFALILAFCVGVGLAARDAGLLDAFSDSFNQGVLASLNVGVDESTSSGNGNNYSGNSGNSDSGNSGSGNSGNSDSGSSDSGNSGNSGNGNSGNSDSDSSDSGDNGNSGGGGGWGTLDPKSYYENLASQAERLAQDQKALENLAKHFIGLTQNKVKELLNNKTADMADNQEILLGHIVPNGKKEDGTFTGMKFQTDGFLNAAEAENIFLWMQGAEVENPVYDPNYMYLVSDYVVSQQWADTAGTFQKNGLRVRFEYDYSGTSIYPDNYGENGAVKVVGVQLSIDPRSQHNEEVSNTQFNKQHSTGLEVHVRLDGKDESGNDKYSTEFKDTGIVTTSGTNGMTNWYGNDVTQATLKTYIESNRNDYSGGITKDFKRGEIFKFQGKYYIATKDENVTINSSDTQAILESGIFIKFTGYSDRYYLENAKKQFDDANQCYKKIIIPEHGSLIILSTGEAYIYVGNEKKMPYTGINDDFIKIR